MPGSAPPSTSEPHGPPGRRLAGDESAVSEVVGYILIFGILSMVLILSMVAFGAVQDRAEARVVLLQADSAAERVASATVDAALFAETYGASANFSQAVLLPDDLEGRAYTVTLEAGPPEQILLEVPGLAIRVTARLFSATAPADISVCASSAAVPGGPLFVRSAKDPANPGQSCLFLSLEPWP